MATASFTRWFQSQVFTPGFRLPADGDAAQPWAAPAPAQRVLVDFIRLRRRLAPYLEAIDANRSDGCVEGGPLPPASLADYTRAGSRLGAFSFGPSLMVQPVPVGQMHDLPVFFPRGAAWLDFWSGASYAGEQYIRTPAPLNVLPLFVPAGSIIPLAFPVAPTDEPADTLELRIYPGANGCLNLPSATSGRRGAGKRASISLVWNDRARVLRIGARPGASSGRTSSRRLHIVIVRPGHGVGHLPPPRPDLSVTYEGAELSLQLPPPPSRPLPPVGLTAKIVTGQVVFTWQQSCEDVLYRLKRTPGLNALHEDIASALATQSCKIPLPARGASKFGYVVTAMNAGGESDPSAVVALPDEDTLSPPAPEDRIWRLPNPALSPSVLCLAVTRPALPVGVGGSRNWSQVPVLG